ncbi:PadR family transcriptional regulator [Plantibacter auratus]|uniref:PadR family transcriptional regulator n=1 Tax=Plantibacter auratus TaxID=272914 RepID=UPI003D34C29E
MERDSKLAALRRGMLEPLVLASVEHQRRYAGEIATALREAGFPVQEATLYPLLNKLRREDLLAHDWQESTSGPPRKYLSLTEAGRVQLRNFRTYWSSLTDLITTIGH